MRLLACPSHITLTKRKSARSPSSREGREPHGAPRSRSRCYAPIYHLTKPLREHKHDHHWRRGLLMLVGRRRRFLNYLQKKDLERYRSLIRELGLRR